MKGAASLRRLVETTDAVKPVQAFEFWRATALAPFGDVEYRSAHEPFMARRLTVASSDWVLTHTLSSPVGLELAARHLDGAASDMVVVGLGIDGVGYQEQAGRGVPLGGGDVSFLDRRRPLLAGAQSDYEEIRLAVRRTIFESRVGRVDRLAGTSITDHAATAEFRKFLRGLAASLHHGIGADAESAVEGLLHLLGRAMNSDLVVPSDELPQAAAEALATAHIIRRLHERDLDPAKIQASLGLSRSTLYRAFAQSGGVAAVIRNARLDLAYRKLTTLRVCPLRISTVAYVCGFADIPTFNRGFRRRFGMSPRDVQAASCAKQLGEQAPIARNAD